MGRWTLLIGCAGVVLLVTCSREAESQTPAAPPATLAEQGWNVPPEAQTMKNPLPSSDALIQSGKKIYADHCQRCHGATGVGDGPDADPDHQPEDLSDPKRLEKNPDGVMFYKIWNGRKKPKMPEFKSELSRQQVWTVTHYVRTLPKKPAS